MDRTLELDRPQFQSYKEKTLDILQTLLIRNSLTRELYDQVAMVSESTDDETYERLIAKLEDNGWPPHIIIDELLPEANFEYNYKHCREADKDKLIAYGLYAFRYGVLAFFELHKWFVNPKASIEEKDAFRENWRNHYDTLCSMTHEVYLPDEATESQREQPSEVIGREQKVDWLSGQKNILTHIKVGSPHTLRKLRNRGLPVIKDVSGSLRADPRELDAWLKKNPKK